MKNDSATAIMLYLLLGANNAYLSSFTVQMLLQTYENYLSFWPSLYFTVRQL